ncbi:Nuclear hormone receptor family member nhr-31 [Caenorhabditis elegans]|uniref:Nuclear hormone receptor family member nhr-31 n=5 Tax=Caenorhabditis elegans TaxID=6239 RepID=NHR31_CAEEL|nr:Nuclear hormone receptor family member nhr-31 [Caenorhabditis elegans]Q18192.2 RecName: Full=Nuclear hormone receptor family member nhr-31 [Caenorhabditis elegans]AAG15125.1 nuclear receptor NHR-31 [Caenorhabditis elegans]CCD65193.1 Nuclear hormone receptor family member nhr-31 [Caenorhabditis elegans]|eukprot:NP_741456.1 Nuclear hormone receptor family member nhr-31 [Caenorhabditis elegans]
MEQLDVEDWEYWGDEYLEEEPTYAIRPGTRVVKVERVPMMRGDLRTSGATSSSGPATSYIIRPSDKQPTVSSGGSQNGDSVCAVCGDGIAKLHYGVLACYGCKGFFRRTLTGKYRYACRFSNNCIVDKFQRNSCRYCRFQRCIQAGMDPKAVRPDRDQTGKQKVPRIKKKQIDEELLNHMMRLQGDDWSRKLPVETRILLMQLMSIEDKVVKGDNNMSAQNTAKDPKSISLREMFESKPALDGRRMEIGYEPFRMARTEELGVIAHRRAIAAVDWVDSLTEIADAVDTEDKVALVKSCYSPLTIFNFSARTAQNTKNPDILCLCSHSFVPRRLPPEFNETNHLSNFLIDRTLNELVAPLRKLNLKEEEIVPLKAIIILNPNAKGLSEHARHAISELRDKVQDMLFQIVKELHPIYSASSRFGNLLLLLPTITTLSGLMSENMHFCQALGGRASGDNLLAEMFGDRTFDDQLISSSISPPLFENPAEICLESISPPMSDRRFVRRVDVATQTNDDLLSSGPYLPHSNSCSSMLNAGYSPPMLSTSPFPLLDDNDSAFQNDISLTELNGCEEFFSQLMDQPIIDS